MVGAYKKGTSQAALDAVRAGTPYKTKAVLIGDSIFNNGQDPGYTLTSAASFTSNTRGWFHWLQAMAGQPWRHLVGWDADALAADTLAGTVAAPYRIGHNWGKGSDTAKLVIDRSEEWLAVVDEKAIAFFNLGTNDPTLWTPTEFIGYVQTIHELCQAKGAHTVWVTTLPRNQVDGSGSAYWSDLSGGLSTRRAKNFQMMKLLRKYAKSATDFTLLDFTTGFVAAATGDGITGLTKDGLHPNQRWAYKLAQKALGELQALIPPPNPNHAISLLDIYDSTNNTSGNLLSNGNMTGTGGSASGAGAASVSGTFASSWNGDHSAAGSGLTVVGSIVTDSTPDALRWQRIALTTAAGAAATFKLKWNAGTNITATGLVAGAWVELSFLLRFQKSSALNNPINGFYAILEDKSASGWDTRWGQAAPSGLDAGWPDEDTEILYCKTMPIKLTGATGLDLDFVWTGGDVAASTQIFDITGVNVYILPSAPDYT